MLREIQDRTGGFTEFVPLPFVHQSSPLYLAGGARPGPTHRDNRAVHALARIMLHGRISNIQTSWVKLGIERTQVMLNGGANDLGGTLMEETISRMAGSEFGSAKSVEELVVDRRGHRPPGAAALHDIRAAGCIALPNQGAPKHAAVFGFNGDSTRTGYSVVSTRIRWVSQSSTAGAPWTPSQEFLLTHCWFTASWCSRP